MKHSQKGFLVPLLAVVIVLVVAGAGWYYYATRTEQQVIEPGVVVPQKVLTDTTKASYTEVSVNDLSVGSKIGDLTLTNKSVDASLGIDLSFSGMVSLTGKYSIDEMFGLCFRVDTSEIGKIPQIKEARLHNDYFCISNVAEFSAMLKAANLPVLKNYSDPAQKASITIKKYRVVYLPKEAVDMVEVAAVKKTDQIGGGENLITYTNIVYGYTVEYGGANFLLQEKEGGVVAITPQARSIEFGPVLTISVSHKTASSLDEYVSAIARTNGFPVISKETVTISGTPWIKFVYKNTNGAGPDFTYVNYFATARNYIYRLTYADQGKENNDAFEAIVKTISLSTAAATSLEMYHQYGFSIAYPSGVIVSDSAKNGSSVTFDFPVQNPSTKGAAIHTRFIVSKVSGGSCPVGDRGEPASFVTITGSSFSKIKVGANFSTMETAAVGEEYCIVQNGVKYTLTPVILFPLHPTETIATPTYTSLEAHQALNQMLASFSID